MFRVPSSPTYIPIWDYYILGFCPAQVLGIWAILVRPELIFYHLFLSSALMDPMLLKTLFILLQSKVRQGCLLESSSLKEDWDVFNMKKRYMVLQEQKQLVLNCFRNSNKDKCLPSTVHCLLLTVNCQLPTVCCQK